jgi:hypothetical protein
MKTIIADITFLAIAAVIVIPTPTLAYAWMTGKTLAQVLYR